MNVSIKPVLGTLSAVLLAGLAGCASTSAKLPIGADLDEFNSPERDQSQVTQYCRPGSAMIYEINSKRLLPPAREYKVGSGTCK